MVSAVARRGFLRVLGALPAALPMAKEHLAKSVGGMEAASAAALSTMPVPSIPGEERLGKFLAKQLRDLNEQFDAEEGLAYQLRVEGIDPDIAALRSTSRAYKVLKMQERRREAMAMATRIRRLMWP